MKHKPLLFIIIGILHLIEPLIKIAYFKATTPFGLDTIISNISAIGTRELFEFWFMFPLAGLALLSVKRWSYPVFVGIQIYSIYTHLTYRPFTWPYVAQVPFYSSLILMAINMGIILYFALPAVRRPFFDRSVRWWESRTRYHLHLPCSIALGNPDILHDCDILNISLGGAWLNYKGVIEDGTVMTLNISYADMAMSVRAVKVHDKTFQAQRGIGVRFQFQNIYENLHMRKILRAVKKAAKEQERRATITEAA